MKVSIVIPTYNSATFLADTVRSVQAQTLTDWELFIIDGGSTDDTAAIAQSFSHADARITWHTRMGGVAISRNYGAQLAKADFVAFLDSDDRWLPARLATHVQHLEQHPNIGISYSRAEFIQVDGTPTGTVSNNRLNAVQPYHFLYVNPTITMSNIVVRRQIIATIPMNESLSYSEDLDWIFCVMVSGGWQIAGIDQILLQYRTNPNGLSSKLQQMESGWMQFIENARQQAPVLVEQHFAAAQAAQLKYLARRALRLKCAPQISTDFMSRALQSDWTLLFREPKTLLLALVIYSLFLTKIWRPHHAKSIRHHSGL
ncbi:MAG: glycosyltransferase family A protein [Cyanobacteria bacterium P01_F01_bin.86]